MAYREKITRAGDVDYTHKKQTGGHGQFARVKIVAEPGEPGAGFVFENEIVGGSVPNEFFPASKRASKDRWAPACWPASRWSISRSAWWTAPITTSIHRRWHSKSARARGVARSAAEGRPGAA